jgi:hypothetical protein
VVVVLPQPWRTRRDVGALPDHLETAMWTAPPPRPAILLGDYGMVHTRSCVLAQLLPKTKASLNLWRAWRSKFLSSPSWAGQLLPACASFFFASVLSPGAQNTLRCRLTMLTSCPRALPTHGNASPTSMPVCGLWPLECYTMGMEEAPDAAPLIVEPGAKRVRCL